MTEPDQDHHTVFRSPGEGGGTSTSAGETRTGTGEIDLGDLVSSWNEEQQAREPVDDGRDTRQKLVGARERLAERVGGHPDGDVVPPPVPEPLHELDEPDPGPISAGENGENGEPDELAGLSWRQRHKAWRTTERQRRKEAKRSVRFPIITRSIALWWLIFALVGLVGGAIAAYFWADFNAEVTSLKAENASLQDIIDQAKSDIETQRAQTLDQINQSLKPLEDYANEGIKTAEQAGVDPNSVWLVNTLDGEGRPVVGSAFVVASDDQQSVMVTSFAAVREATIAPGPEVKVRTASEEQVAEVWNWDEGQDLAVLIVKRPGLPPIEWASDEDAAAALGKRLFVVGGLGGAGISAVPGLVVDQSGVGIQHTAPVGTAYQGGPIVTGGGKLLAIASLTYAPLGFAPGEVRFAVPIGSACRTVLACGGGVIQASGEGPVGAPDPNAAPNTQD